jgi:hypothetical protein
MKEMLYDQSSLAISVALMVLMSVAIETGYRFGIKNRIRSNTAKEQVSTIQSSLLGILALMLGFTFSLALNRFDTRSVAVVNEANCIGTAYLRTDLLAEPSRSQEKKLLLDYLKLRVEAGGLALDNHHERDHLLEKATQIQEQIWQKAMQASLKGANSATTGLFIQALNDMIDAYGVRIAELNRHVPELVLFMLYGSFIITGGIIGYTAGIGGQRPATASYIMIALVVLLMSMVVDLDRPRRGFIQISQQSLIDLNEALNDANTRKVERVTEQP